MSMDDARIKLILDMGRSGADAAAVRKELEFLDAAARKTGDGFDKVTPAAKSATKGAADFGRSALETGRIVQDFAQGGWGGIVNNLEGFTRAIGLGSGAAGAMTILGVAALMAAPAVKALWREIIDGSNEVPKSIDPLKRLNEELAENKKRLGELKDQQTLTNTELAEFNRLTAESTRLEQEAATAKAAAAARGEKTDDASKLAAAVKKLTSGPDFDKVAGNAGSDPVATASAKADLERQLKEQEALVAKLPANIAVRKNGQYENTPNPVRQGAIVKAQDLRTQIAELVKNAEGWNKDAQDLIVRARNGDMGAYDELLKRTTGDVHDQLAAVDPRKAGLRGMAQAAAKGQIADAIGGAVNPIIGALKDRNAAAKQGIDQAKAIDAQQDEAAKAAEKAQRAADKASAKGLADVQAAGRNVVPEPMLKKQPLMDLAPDGGGWDGLDGGGLMDDPGYYRPRSHDERIEANRRRKAGNRGGGGLRNVGVGPPGDAAEAQQALGGAMQDLQAVAAGAGAWKPAFQQIATALRMVQQQVNGQGFNPYQSNRPVSMDMGNW